MSIKDLIKELQKYDKEKLVGIYNPNNGNADKPRIMYVEETDIVLLAGNE